MNTPSLPESLVRELIQRHARSTSHRAEFDPDVPAAEVVNPVCGDVVRVQLVLEDDRVAEARLGGHGCALSQASASMVATQISGRTWAEVRSLDAAFVEMIEEGSPPPSDLGDLRAVAGVGRFPNRVRCVLLVWEAVRQLDPGR